jgi:hypothetical protein
MIHPNIVALPRQCIAKKKTVSFSSTAKLRRVFNDNNNNQKASQSSWLTAGELSSMKKRAQKLSILHYNKTRPGRHKAPSRRSGIVYNCHPAHYEIIGESLRGMEHRTDTSKAARRRERLRSDAITLVEEHQNQDMTRRSKMLACMYRESTKEAILYSREIAEEDAKVAATILAEDLKQDDDVASTTTSSSSPSPCSLASPNSLDYLGAYCFLLQYQYTQTIACL